MTPDDAFDRVRGDPTLRAVLEAARSWGVAPSVFLDNGPTQRILVERDGAGRVAALIDRSWTLDDRLLAVAFHAYERDVCDGCGLPLSETTAPEAEFAYSTPLPIRCWACNDIAAAAEAEERRHPQALRWPVVRKSSASQVLAGPVEVDPSAAG